MCLGVLSAGAGCSDSIAKVCTPPTGVGVGQVPRPPRQCPPQTSVLRDVVRPRRRVRHHRLPEGVGVRQAGKHLTGLLCDVGVEPLDPHSSRLGHIHSVLHDELGLDVRDGGGADDTHDSLDAERIDQTVEVRHQGLDGICVEPQVDASRPSASGCDAHMVHDVLLVRCFTHAAALSGLSDWTLIY